MCRRGGRRGSIRSRRCDTNRLEGWWARPQVIYACDECSWVARRHRALFPRSPHSVLVRGPSDDEQVADICNSVACARRRSAPVKDGVPYTKSACAAAKQIHRLSRSAFRRYTCDCDSVRDLHQPGRQYMASRLQPSSLQRRSSIKGPSGVRQQSPRRQPLRPLRLASAPRNPFLRWTTILERPGQTAC